MDFKYLPMIADSIASLTGINESLHSLQGSYEHNRTFFTPKAPSLPLKEQIRSLQQDTVLNPFEDERVLLPDFATSLPLQESNFHQFNQKTSKDLCFVAGCAIDLFSNKLFILRATRYYCATWRDEKKMSHQKYEFFTLIRLKTGRRGWTSKIKYYGDINLYLKDKNVFNPYTDPDINCCDKVILSEIAKKQRYILFNGTLGASLFIDCCLKKNREYQSIAKRSVIAIWDAKYLKTQKGDSAVRILDYLAPHGAWWYTPLLPESTGFSRCFTKLCLDSSTILMIETSTPPDWVEILGSLQVYSENPHYRGYPYCLVDAKKLAHIDREEVENRQTQLLRLVYQRIRK